MKTINNNLISLTEKLIENTSGIADTGNLKEVLDIVKKQLSEYPFLSFSSNGIPSLLFYNQKQEQKNFKVILNTHLDVWQEKQKPQQSKIENGKIYGKDIYHTKAAAAAMILSYKDIAKKVSYPLALQISGNYTAQGEDTTRYQLEQGVQCDFAIVGEGTDFSIVYETKGRYILKLQTKDEEQHTGLLKLNKTIKLLIDKYSISEKETYKTTVTLVGMEMTPEKQWTAEIDVRYPLTEKAIVFSTIRELVPQDISIEVASQLNPARTDPENPYIQTLQKTAGSISNTSVSLRKTFGSSDARHFSDKGIPVVEFGPAGYGHTKERGEEWVDMQSLVEYDLILKKFLLSIA